MNEPIFSSLTGKVGECGSACQPQWCCYGFSSLSDCVNNGPGTVFDPSIDANEWCSYGLYGGEYNPETPWLMPCDTPC